jgi:hypothetical protein
MIRVRFSLILLLIGASALRGTAQPASPSTDLAVTYTPEYAKVSGIDCGCFWFQGGAADAAVTFHRGLGIAASLTGQQASSVSGGNGVSKVAYLFGPRFTFGISRQPENLLLGHGTTFFGEALFGGMHGFDSIFPSSSGAKPSANSFAFQLGGGMDVALARGLGIRAIELDYVRSSLPNSGSGTQNDLRIAVGLSYRFGWR